jgi:hypothetical protein
MARTSNRGSSRPARGRWIRLLITRILLPIGLLAGLLWWRIDVAVDKQFKPLEQIADVRRGRTFFNLQGEVGVAQLSLSPRAGAAEPISLRTGRIALQTPGLWWLIRASLFGVPDELPRRLGISVANLEVEGRAQGPEAGFIGAFSAIPMEAAGCNADLWTRADLREMGLPASDTVLQASFEHSDAGIVTLSTELATPGVGRMQGRLAISVPSAGAVRADGLVQGRLVELSLGFVDEGFIAARNRYCTTRVTTSLADFNRIHSDAVTGLLRTVGLRPDADLLRAYAHFASEGGELRIETRPSSNLGLLQLAGMDREALWQALAPYVRVTGVDPVRLAFVFVRPMSLRAQQRAAEIAAARLLDGVPLDPDMAEVVSEPPRVPSPEPPVVPVPMPERDGRIDYADLAPYVGRELRVATIYGSARRGTLLDYAKARLVLRLPDSQGGFDLTVPAETVREIRVLDAAAIQPDSSTDITNAQAN